MDPQKALAKELLNEKCCVTIPKYQRRYSWNIENAHSLIRDIAEVATSSSPSPHWTGVIIHRDLPPEEKCPLGTSDLNHICREIIDGQQRLTTILLWLKALLDQASSQGVEVNYQLPPFYLQSPNDRQFKAIIDGNDVSQNTDNLSRVYSYFRFILWLGQAALLNNEPLAMPDRRTKGPDQVSRWQNWLDRKGSIDESLRRSASVDCESLIITTIGYFSFLSLKLDNHDDAERVFSALNGNRTELYPFDHLRNFVFSRIDRRTRDSKYQDFWEPAEKEFDSLQTKKGTGRDGLKSTFLYDYLISVGAGSMGQFNAIRSFSAFVKFERSVEFRNNFNSLDWWVESRFHDEVTLWKIQREEFSRKDLPSGTQVLLSARSRRILHRIRLVSDGPPAPLVMFILRRAFSIADERKKFTPTDVENSLLALESYMFKTRLSGSSLTNMRAAVIHSMAEIDRACVSDQSGTAAEKLVKRINGWTTVRWVTLRGDLNNAHQRPQDDGVYETLRGAGTLALLDCIDSAISGDQSRGFLPKNWELGAYPFEVEHIFPQKEKKWKSDLRSWGVEESEMTKRRHSLGNLSAIPKPLNESIKNNRFEDKRQEVTSNQDAMLTRLQSWTENDRWTDREIDDRTNEMVRALEQMWPDPQS